MQFDVENCDHAADNGHHILCSDFDDLFEQKYLYNGMDLLACI